MIHHVEVQVLVILLIASVVGIAARRLQQPYTLALVLAGLALSFVELETLKDVALTPELLLLLFLPPLLFEAAYHLPLEDVRKNMVHILYLAVFGVLAGVGIAAVLSYGLIHQTGLATEFGWSHAFLFAATLAATDPISVLALFKEVGAPKRLYQVVEGESLVNDGVAVVIFSIVGTVIGLPLAHGGGGGHAELHGAQDIAVFAIMAFVKTGLGGILVGAAIGGLASVTTRSVDDHLIEITLTTLVAWGSFLVAEELGASGVLSTVSAGVVMGSFGSRYGMSASTRIAVVDFWEYMGFVSNSFIFLLVGLELEPSVLLADAGVVVIGFVVLMVARSILIYGGLPFIDRITAPLPKKWRHVLVWGGLRGSLSMVLILGLPMDFPGRHLLVNLVFGVVAISLFLQGLTMGPLMNKLGVQSDGGLAMTRDYELARGRALAFRQVVNEADRLKEEGLIDATSHERLRGWYAAHHEHAQETARDLAGDTARPEWLLEGARTLATIEKEALNHAVRNGVISENAGAEMLDQLDRRLDGLDRASHDSEKALMGAFAELYPPPSEAVDEEPAA